MQSYIIKELNIKKQIYIVKDLCGIILPPASRVQATLLQQYITLSSSLISSHSVLNTFDSLQCSKSCKHRTFCLLQGILLFRALNKTAFISSYTSVQRWM